MLFLVLTFFQGPGRRRRSTNERVKDDSLKSKSQTRPPATNWNVFSINSNKAEAMEAAKRKLRTIRDATKPDQWSGVNFDASKLSTIAKNPELSPRGGDSWSGGDVSHGDSSLDVKTPPARMTSRFFANSAAKEASLLHRSERDEETKKHSNVSIPTSARWNGMEKGQYISSKDTLDAEEQRMNSLSFEDSEVLPGRSFSEWFAAVDGTYVLPIATFTDIHQSSRSQPVPPEKPIPTLHSSNRIDEVMERIKKMSMNLVSSGENSSLKSTGLSVFTRYGSSHLFDIETSAKIPDTYTPQSTECRLDTVTKSELFP